MLLLFRFLPVFCVSLLFWRIPRKEGYGGFEKVAVHADVEESAHQDGEVFGDGKAQSASLCRS